MKLVRYIHPVGQGAFYTEQFFDENNERLATVVYDCGAQSNKKAIEREINGMFVDTDNKMEIDILFISHFHEDHINGIAELKKRAKIKNVIIPLYDNDKQLLLLATLRHRNKNDKLEELIKDPVSFFSGSNVVRVKKWNNNEYQNLNPIDTEEIEREKDIDSGRPVVIKNPRNKQIIWEYIPFNHYDQNREHEFEKLIPNFQADLKSRIDDKEFQAILKDTYNSLVSKECFNAFSLMVYSGIYSMNCTFNFEEIYPNGCLFTGDATFSNVVSKKLSDHLGKRCSNLTMIQIPHHGSNNSFHDSIFSLLKNGSTYPILFLSCGNHNTYGHPSPFVVSRCNLYQISRPDSPILMHKYKPFMEQGVRIVSESKDTLLVLVFDF